MDEDIFGNDRGVEDGDVESAVDVMKDYLEEENSSSSEGHDIYDELWSDSNEIPEKPHRKKFVWGAHIKIIDGKPPTCYHCTICDSYFSHSNTARNHEFCGSGKKPYKCNLCDKRFVNNCDRDNHYRTHSGERPYECSICKKTFHLKHKLSRHIRSHTGIKGDFQCLKCQRSFICKEALRKHEVSKHTSNKATKCKKCKQVFDNSSQLLKHRCPKVSKKKLVCEICGKTFSTNWNLTVHQRIHKGQRPYECINCRKRFRLRQHLERHSAKHQPEADFECTLCNQTFGRKDNMIRHLKLTHADSNFGVHLDEIMKRAEKVKKDKMKKAVVEIPTVTSEIHSPAVPTVITVDNLPNIRFAKMPPKRLQVRSVEKVPGGSADVVASSKPTEVSSESTKSPKPMDDSAGRVSAPTAYAAGKVKSMFMTTTVIKSGNQVVRRTTTKVVQSSVICPTDSPIDSDGIDQDQLSCNLYESLQNKWPVIQPTNSKHDAAKAQHHSSDLPESPKPTTHHLPVSVLCFHNSSELRRARPKNIASNPTSKS